MQTESTSQQIREDTFAYCIILPRVIFVNVTESPDMLGLLLTSLLVQVFIN